MHCQYIICIEKQLINGTDTFLWQLREDLKAETESQMRATQNRTLQTKYHAKYIANRSREQIQIMPKILRDSRIYYTSRRNFVKRTKRKET